MNKEAKFRPNYSLREKHEKQIKEKNLAYEAFTKCHELRDKKLEEIELLDTIINSLSEKLDTLP